MKKKSEGSGTAKKQGKEHFSSIICNFFSNGNADFDIDYTDHGNEKEHPKVPHKHKWDWSDPNNPKRGKAE